MIKKENKIMLLLFQSQKCEYFENFNPSMIYNSLIVQPLINKEKSKQEFVDRMSCPNDWCPKNTKNLDNLTISLGL